MANSEPKVGDECKADPIGEGKFLFGHITKIEDGLAEANLVGFSDFPYFVGDTPTRRDDGVWIFDSF